MGGLSAAALGGLSQASLLLSGLVVYWVHPSKRVIGALAGFGAGALIAAVAFDLAPQAGDLGSWEAALWLLGGALVYIVADRIVERRFGGDAGGPLGIVVGAVVDGVPESLIFGMQVAAGAAISPSFLTAVFVSNVPQALAPSASLADDGWPRARMAGMWGIVVVACAVTSWIGFAVGLGSGLVGDRAAAIAAGGLLAMLTDSLVPYAMDEGGPMAGFWTVVGFAISMAM